MRYEPASSRGGSVTETVAISDDTVRIARSNLFAFMIAV